MTGDPHVFGDELMPFNYVTTWKRNAAAYIFSGYVANILHRDRAICDSYSIHAATWLGDDRVWGRDSISIVTL